MPRPHANALHRLATLYLLVAAPACSSSTQGSGTAGDFEEKDLDGVIARTEQALTNARGTERARLDERLRYLRGRGAAAAVEAGERALSDRDLASAEAAFQRGIAYLPDDYHARQGLTKVQQIREKAHKAITTARSDLQRLGNQPYTPEQRNAWTALTLNLEWLGLWERDLPDAAALRQQALPVVVGYYVGDAKALVAAGKPDEAMIALQKALKWSPNHPGAAELLAELQASSDSSSIVKRAQQMVQDGRYADAVTVYQQALERAPNVAALNEGLRNAKGNWVAALLQQAKEADRAGQLGLAVAALAQSRGVGGTDDTAVADEVQRLSLDVDTRAVQRIYPQFQAAVQQGCNAAALVYGRVILTLLTDYKDVAKRMQKLEPAVAARLEYRVALPPPQVPPGSVAALSPAVAAALQVRLRATGLDKKKVVLVGKGQKADAVLKVAIGEFGIVRRQEQEDRSKPFLDRVEVVDNADWPAAQGRQTAALGELNAALDKLRPVLADVNAAESSLHVMQEQVLQIRTKVADEDTAFYKGKASPCRDGTLNCAETRGHTRWKANIDFYDAQIAKENAKLVRLGPELRRLQQAVDEAQKTFDAAQQLATETPQRQPKEVWQTHAYQVTRHFLDMHGKLEAVLEAGKARTTAGQQQLAEQRSDFSSATVMVKGQVLEPQHASELPDDASVTADVSGRLLDAALPPILSLLGRHAERHYQAAQSAKSDLERVHHLALAAMSLDALPIQLHADAVQRLAELTGYRADSGIVVFENVVPASKK
jgi:tetratricopeptide (TPR) repeat protein